MKAQKKTLFCTFIEFCKALDSIWRIGLWEKLITNGINGKCFNIIYNMYQNTKSCVRAHNSLIDYFSCCVGVRQGKNVSPLLFSPFLNDIEDFRTTDCRGIAIDIMSSDSLIHTSIGLLVLLYADDTVLNAEKERDVGFMVRTFAHDAMVVGSILHGGPIELFLVPASALCWCNKDHGM